MSNNAVIYHFNRLYTGDTLFNRTGKLVYNCRLYEIKDEAGETVAKYYAGDIESFIELPGKLYLLKDETTWGIVKKSIGAENDTGEFSAFLKMNYWNTAGTVILNKNHQYRFRITKPAFPVLNRFAPEKEYELGNDHMKIHYRLSVHFPGLYGPNGASPADGIIQVAPGKLLLSILGIVMIDMAIRGYEKNTDT